MPIHGLVVSAVQAAFSLQQTPPTASTGVRTAHDGCQASRDAIARPSLSARLQFSLAGPATARCCVPENRRHQASSRTASRAGSGTYWELVLGQHRLSAIKKLSTQSALGLGLATTLYARAPELRTGLPRSAPAPPGSRSPRNRLAFAQSPLPQSSPCRSASHATFQLHRAVGPGG